MARYILIDNESGYIWGDSADLDGRIFTGTPAEYAAALDASLGKPGLVYEECSAHALGAIGSTHAAVRVSGYHVYRADIGASEVVPVVWDGQDQETIGAVERDCEYLTTLRCDREG